MLTSRAPIASAEKDGRGSATTSHREAVNVVLRTPARRERNDHVARAGQRFDLSREHGIERVVVGDAGHDRRIDAQGDRRQRPPLPKISPDQLRREVLGVGRAPAIPERVEATARSEGRTGALRDCLEHGQQVLDGIERGAMLLDLAGWTHVVAHRASIEAP